MNKAGSIQEIILRALAGNNRVVLKFSTGMGAYLDECLISVVIK